MWQHDHAPYNIHLIFLTAIANEMLKVKQKVKEENEREKKIYSKMFA